MNVYHLQAQIPLESFFQENVIVVRSVGVLKFLMMFCIFLLNEQEKTHLALI